MFDQKIELLQQVKQNILADTDRLDEIIRLAEVKNKWFIAAHSKQSIDAILTHFFDEKKLYKWLKIYKLESNKEIIGLILAGNLPLVGFHDVLCCFMLDCPTKIKLSSKDEVLMRYFVEQLQNVDSNWQVEIVERLVGYDKVIATGGANTNRYFEQYFEHVPSLLRSNRTSIAVLNGDESKDDLVNLSIDIFTYFGLGCRNVSKLFLPSGFDVTKLFPCFEELYSDFFSQKVYMDNYDYNRTLLLMNSVKHLSNNFVILKEDKSMHARLATVHYEFYDSIDDVKEFINSNADDIQCVVGKEYIPFGKAQQPALWDYADNIDTLDFLLK